MLLYPPLCASRPLYANHPRANVHPPTKIMAITISNNRQGFLFWLMDMEHCFPRTVCSLEVASNQRVFKNVNPFVLSAAPYCNIYVYMNFCCILWYCTVFKHQNHKLHSNRMKSTSQVKHCWFCFFFHCYTVIPIRCLEGAG